MLTTLSEDLKGLLNAAAQLAHDAPAPALLNDIVARGDFRPAEDEAVGFWFARFLTTRNNLWVIINEVRDVLDDPTRPTDSIQKLKYFLVGYAAMCTLIRIDRIMLFDVAGHSLVQRKLNQAFPEYRIPRKQYTRIFSGFVDQGNVLAIRDAMHFANRHGRKLLALEGDANVGFIVPQLRELEAALNPSKRSHLRRAWAYISHKWRRRGVVSVERVFAKILEGFGRAAAEFVDLDDKRVTSDVLESVASMLRPGDVLVTRHAKALTNLFFPGVWPHAAFCVDTPSQGQACVLEAKKDGVRLRPLEETLLVDAFVVLRPNLGADSIRQAVERGLRHEGKKYNFDFNFFNSDRIVCTELVYRAYDGLEEMKFPLIERAGRKTLSAEDLLDYALDTGAFTPVAIFGTKGAEDAVVFGDRVRDLLLASYR